MTDSIKRNTFQPSGQGESDDQGREYVEYGSGMRGILEELEKAHIHIEQLHNQNESLEARLNRVEQVLAGRAEKSLSTREVSHY